jgi:cytochrome c oxidase subunit II
MRADRRRVLGGAIAMAAGAMAGAAVWAQPQERVIKVVARKFVFLPSDIAVKQGEAVVLEFTSPEVVMGFYAPDLNLRAVLVPNEVARVRFTPARAGTFPFICDIFCGDGHESMSGRIVVT